MSPFINASEFLMDGGVTASYLFGELAGPLCQTSRGSRLGGLEPACLLRACAALLNQLVHA